VDVAAGSLDGGLVAQVVVEHGIVAFDDLASCVPCAVAAAAACLAVAETYFENVAVVPILKVWLWCHWRTQNWWRTHHWIGSW